MGAVWVISVLFSQPAGWDGFLDLWSKLLWSGWYLIPEDARWPRPVNVKIVLVKPLGTPVLGTTVLLQFLLTFYITQDT